MALEWHQSRTGSLFVMAAVSFPYLNEFHRILYQSQRLGLGLRKHACHGLRILEGRPQQGNNRRFFFCVLDRGHAAVLNEHEGTRVGRGE